VLIDGGHTKDGLVDIPSVIASLDSALPLRAEPFKALTQQFITLLAQHRRSLEAYAEAPKPTPHLKTQVSIPIATSVAAPLDHSSAEGGSVGLVSKHRGILETPDMLKELSEAFSPP